MPNTYTQLHVQIVFTVQGRANLIPKQHKEALHQYITAIVRNKKHKVLAINSMPDHVHLFVGLNPDESLSDLVRDVKANSSAFIKAKKWIPSHFAWQKGYGAFSYGHSQIDAVVKYIKNQEKHHAKKSFKEEYIEMLERFNVSYDNKYLFEWIEQGAAPTEL
jgi:REP element-mobilizing transposase RayT